jgi:PAS domain-containing protein
MTRRADILGRPVFEVFPDNPDDPAANAIGNSRESFKRVLRTHVADAMVVQRHDVRRPESEGGGFEVRYWSPFSSPILNPDGSLAYIIHRVENEQSKIEEALRGSEELLKTFVRYVPAAVAMLDREMRYVQVSDRWCADFSLTSGEILGRSHYEVRLPALCRDHLPLWPTSPFSLSLKPAYTLGFKIL